jgi:hypothetical protein
VALCRHPYMGPIFHMRALVQATSSFSQPASLRIKSNATTSTIGRLTASQRQEDPVICPTIASDWVCAEFLISPAQRFELASGTLPADYMARA